MGRRLEYEVKTSVRLNMSNPQHVKINDVIQNLDPKIFKSKNQFIIDAIQFYIDNYGKETFVIKKKEKERAEYIRSEDIDDIKEEVIEAATNEAWQIGIGNIKAPEPDSGFVCSYLDVAYNGNIFMWDSAFMMMFARFGTRFFQIGRAHV